LELIIKYINAALSHAHYEIIKDEEPYYGEISQLQGVWATGKSLEECRENLTDVIGGWIIIRIQKGIPIPPVDGITIQCPGRFEPGVRA